MTIEHVFVDADSILYSASGVPTFKEATIVVRGKLKAIREACLGNMPEPWKHVTAYAERSFSGGKGNFRRHVACSLPYKGNRAGKPKPQWLAEIRKWAFGEGVVKPVHWMEAEDKVSIDAHAYGLDKCCIASIDKDLHQIAGTFYDYRKACFYHISPDEADRNFWLQVLTGDLTDNILGIGKGFGPVAAEKALAGCKTPLQREKAVRRLYKQKGHSEAYLLEQARLIYILRHPGDVFTLTEKEV